MTFGIDEPGGETNVQYSMETLKKMDTDDLVSHLEDFIQRAIAQERDNNGVSKDDINYMDRLARLAYTQLGYIPSE